MNEAVDPSRLLRDRQESWQLAVERISEIMAQPLPDIHGEDFFHQEGLNARALAGMLAERGIAMETVPLPLPPLSDMDHVGVFLANSEEYGPLVISGFSGEDVILFGNEADEKNREDGVNEEQSVPRQRVALSSLDELWSVAVADPGDARSEELHRSPRRHWLLTLLGNQRRWYRDLLVASVLINLLGLVVPLFTMNVYDRVVPNQAIETLWVLVSVVLIVLLFDWLLKGARARITDYAGREIDITVSQRLFEKILGMELRNRPQSSAVFAKQVQEFDAVRDFLTSATLVTLVDLPFSLIFIALIAWLGGSLFLIPVMAMLVLTLYAWVLRKRVAAAIENGARYSSQRQAMLMETLQNLPDIKQGNLQSHNKRKWRSLVASLADNAIDSRDAINALSHAIGSIQGLVTVLLIVFGVYRIAEGDLSMGGLIALVMLSGRMSATVNQVSMLLLRGQHMKTALSALDTIMALPQERQLSGQFGAQSFDGNIQLQDVTFGWPETSDPALKSINLTMRPGQRIALCGPSGSGKSTLLALLAGQMEPDAGRLMFSSVERGLWPMTRLRDEIAWCGQAPGLFWGTLLENIITGQPQVTEKKLLAALKNSGVDSMLSTIENGLQCQVGEAGSHLSGGQRQAVAVARTLLKSSRVYLFDEPTSAMDQAMEQRVLRGLAQLPDDALVVIATHRPALLASCDRVLVMDKGVIKADGPAKKKTNQETRKATRVTLAKGDNQGRSDA